MQLANGKRRLVVGELPKQLIAVRREGRSYRRSLETEVIAAHGQISMTHAHHIDTASAATIGAAIARWCLRHKLGEMSTNEVLACSKAIMSAKQVRDGAVRQLGLDAPPANPWAIDVESEADD
jgi:hypothetical protein